MNSNKQTKQTNLSVGENANQDSNDLAEDTVGDGVSVKINPGDNKVSTLTYLDSRTKVQMAKETYKDETFQYGGNVDSDIERFLSRPVRIHADKWLLGSSLDVEIDPWGLFLSNAAIRKKIANYALMRFDLVLELRINGSPFHYGRAMMAYDPFKGVVIRRQLAITNPEMRKMAYSQRKPCVFFDPYCVDTVTMKIPYFAPQDYIAIAPYRTNGMGLVRLISLVNLNVASANATNEVDITIFAHAENVTLGMPTTLQIQGDEYEGDGYVSAPAAAVAKISSSLEDVPIVGRFAKATSIGASAVGNIAKIFGFSKPANIDPITTVKREIFSNSANAIGKDNINKLSLDPKQEVSIDAKTLGLEDGEDCMTVAHIASRESYLTTFVWNTSEVPDYMIGNVCVTPMHTTTTPVGSNDAIQFSSSAFAAFPFKYWGGSMIYRISVVASQYHRGRLRVHYEPNNAVFNPESFNTTYTTIIDLDQNREVELCIGPAQSRPFMYVSNPVLPTFNTGPALYNDGYYNGTLYFSVLNELTSPDDNAPVEVIVSSRAGDDFRVFGFKDNDDPNKNLNDIFGSFPSSTSTDSPPTPGLFPDINPQGYDDMQIEIQSDMEDPQIQSVMKHKCVDFVGKMDSDAYDQRATINHGDPILSFRYLLKRWQRVETNTLSVETTQNSVNVVDIVRPNFPLIGGLSFSRTDQNYLINPDGDYYNPQKTHLLSYLAMGYAAWKGGIRYRYYVLPFNKAADNPDSMLYIERLSTLPNNVPSTWMKTTEIPADGAYQYVNPLINALPKGIQGYHLTDSKLQNCIEVEFPWYSPTRFCVNRQEDPLGLAFDCSNQQHHRFKIVQQAHSSTAANNLIAFTSDAAIGEDFNFTWYVGAPALYLWS